MSDDQRLSDVLSEFARTMGTDFPIQGILDHLVERIVDIMPITAAGVTLISPGMDPRYVAASNAAALRFEQLQSECSEGPCLVAYETGDAVSVPDLRQDTRFPTFGPRAIEAGLVAVFTFPLRREAGQLGALDLYRDTAGPLDATSMTSAQTLADVAAAYLTNAETRAELKESAERSRQTSLHDPLTGLPNRVLLLERLDHAIRRGRRSGTVAAVLFADLDQFKLVNDSHGHRVGDELLVAVAERMTAQLRPGDTLARLSGDEFVIVCEDLAESAEAETIATRLEAAFTVPFTLSIGEVTTTASIGIAFAKDSDSIPEALLDNADTAMYQAKRRGGGRHKSIDQGELRLVGRRASMQRDLRHACERSELQLAYQPIVTTVDGQIIGVEALVRWPHPSLGLIPAATLVPVAERGGYITEIGRWVLDNACPDLRRWRPQTGAGALFMSVNVSAEQLMSADFASTLEALLVRTGIDPAQLMLEVTESVFVQDSQRAMVVFKDLKSLGVRLALDDFGTGYSSLSYLSRFPVDVVKIDQGFVAELGHDKASHAIVAAIVDLSHVLGLTIIAEGVETATQYEQVAELGCDACQGYFFARPMSADSVDALMSGRLDLANPRLPLSEHPGDGDTPPQATAQRASSG